MCRNASVSRHVCPRAPVYVTVLQQVLVGGNPNLQQPCLAMFAHFCGVNSPTNSKL